MSLLPRFLTVPISVRVVIMDRLGLNRKTLLTSYSGKDALIRYGMTGMALFALPVLACLDAMELFILCLPSGKQPPEV